MNREREFDQLLRAWLDDGAEIAPERFVHDALDDIERTVQRPRWRISLEGYLMRARPAPILAVAAVAVLAVVAYIAFARPNVGQESPTPTPRAITSQDLPALVLSANTAPEGMFVDSITTGASALARGLPTGSVIDETGFLGARYVELSGPAGAVATWAALYATQLEAERATDFFAERHEAADGWGLVPLTGVEPLGDESVAYLGPAYGLDVDVTIYLWRVNNVVLATIGLPGTDAQLVRGIADEMNASAH
jgi:hypothetical protein